MPWDPDQYQLFSGPRTRPALDLLRSFEIRSPQYVVDLGCGAGNLTALLAARWPAARVEGIDNSVAMLERAQELGANVTWINADITQWEPDSPVDVLFSNAALHWLDDHPGLIERLVGTLSRESVLAVQMPDNHREASHQVALTLASDPRWQRTLDPVIREFSVLTPDEYLELLQPHFDTVDMWRTTYMQVLEGEHAVADWVQGSFLKPLLDALDDDLAAGFLNEYRSRIKRHYSTQADGRTRFPFSRLFFVAQRQTR
jgi:trans-aconitate 2-methyltransferase